jgi:hypothetical protein
MEMLSEEIPKAKAREKTLVKMKEKVYCKFGS